MDAGTLFSPHITFKAGKCDFDPSTKKVTPLSEPGYLYLYEDAVDDLLHFCWRPRNAPLSAPTNLDLTMVPTDGTFRPYVSPSAPKQDKVASPVAGRICVLKFASSEARHFFWLQSREQPPGQENRSVFSDRDLRLCKIVDALLQNEEIDDSEVEEVRRMGRGGGGGGTGGDTEMGDAAPEGTGGAGADATGGDVREEGEESREGGADGARAQQTQQNQQPDLANLLASINASTPAQQQQQQQQQQPAQTLSTTLSDLLPSSTTVSALASLPITEVDRLLLDHLPAEILTLAVREPKSTPQESLAALGEAEKRRILERVLRSPQFAQALSSITSAIRDGGLPSVAEALGVRLDEEGGGYVPGTGEAVNGGAAVEIFLQGLKRWAERKGKEDR